MSLPSAFWSASPDELLRALQCTAQGLTAADADARLARDGANRLTTTHQAGALSLLLTQFTSPIILILFFAAGLSAFLGEATDAIIILVIVIASGVLGFWQERGAADAVSKLLAIVQTKATVWRDGKAVEIPADQIVAGDVLDLSAGGNISADCLILQSTDCYVDEAALTGETYPVAKSPGTLTADTPLAQRTNALFMGTHVVSGTARALVVRTGAATEFGHVSERLKLRPPETEFERGVRAFGYLLLRVTLVLVTLIFAINVYLDRPVVDAFIFSLALAVGLTPQLLPAIISINLSHGARKMARAKVIVKRLSSIENFGSMNVLCSDKTGTLTEGVVHVQSVVDVDGHDSDDVLRYAYLNAMHESGFVNPIDDAIRSHKTFDITGYGKLGEVPYDFVRKRLSILLAHGANHLIVTKGALANVLDVCDRADVAGGGTVPLAERRQAIDKRFAELGGQGFRTLGVAYRDAGDATRISKGDERDMTFAGFLVLFDPPKADIGKTIGQLKDLGVTLKMITGDNRLVAAYACRQVGLGGSDVLAGPDLEKMSDDALMARVTNVHVFAEIEPNQKERIILALQKAGHVVGYMGDGINDASALHAADVGISVESAVDVAKEAADIVLLEKTLDVLVDGVREGRTTFANTLKYVFMATSANFGNMFSMAGVSLFLPFLPLLPKQILLTNLLTDLPEMTIASDLVDPEMVDRPRRWDIKAIRRFMMVFGLVSSIFDYLTFGVLMYVLHATPEQFRTGWFLESVISASMIVLVIRTRKPFFRSRPGGQMLTATLAVAAITVLLPFTPLAPVLGLAPPSALFLGVLCGIVALYIGAAEIVKALYYRANPA